MNWSTKVKEKALVACGRHCCICHKFCGLKIELHHIKHKSEGGGEEFDNCIPLCFDCHADQRSYDHKHPKGIKYSEQELILHRDNWYNKVKNSAAITNLPEYLKLDRKVFKKVKKMLPYDAISTLIREDSVARREDLKVIYNLVQEAKNPEYSFFDSDLEGHFVDLCSKADSFYGHLVLFTQLFKDSEDIFELKFNSELDRKKSSDLAFTFEDAYSAFIQLARRKLAV